MFLDEGRDDGTLQSFEDARQHGFEGAVDMTQVGDEEEIAT